MAGALAEEKVQTSEQKYRKKVRFRSDAKFFTLNAGVGNCLRCIIQSRCIAPEVNAHI